MIGVRMVNVIVLNWLLTSLNASIVTDWDDTNWEGIPYIIPVVELRDRPIGRDPEMIENDSSSPSTEGETENGLFFDRTYEDRGYENEEMGVRMVNERENDWSLTSLNALIVINWDDTVWEGIPEMIPVVELRDRPIGRDPEMIENDSSSPSTVGATENEPLIGRT